MIIDAQPLAHHQTQGGFSGDRFRFQKQGSDHLPGNAGIGLFKIGQRQLMRSQPGSNVDPHLRELVCHLAEIVDGQCPFHRLVHGWQDPKIRIVKK